MPDNETTTITETAPDGTETTYEITTTKPEDAADDKGILEEVFEAIFDDGSDTADTDDATTDEVTDADAEDVDPMYAATPSQAEINMDSVEFSMDQASFPTIAVPDAETDGSSRLDAASTDDSTADAEAAEQAAHADAAKEAQDAADEFVAQGDYAAAAEARETAENEAYAAGDNSMLGSSDSGDMENAAWQQENADYYRDQQAQDIAAGDYEGAKEDAQNVAYATGDADYQAGGSDHTGQADKDVANLDWAVWDQKNADAAANDAAAYAAEGDFDQAQVAADHAADYGAVAGEYADHADPTSVGYDYDASSAVDSGGGYEAVDTGFDAGAVDTSAASTYDSGTDDV